MRTTKSFYVEGIVNYPKCSVNCAGRYNVVSYIHLIMMVLVWFGHCIWSLILVFILRLSLNGLVYFWIWYSVFPASTCLRFAWWFIASFLSPSFTQCTVSLSLFLTRFRKNYAAYVVYYYRSCFSYGDRTLISFLFCSYLEKKVLRSRQNDGINTLLDEIDDAKKKHNNRHA